MKQRIVWRAFGLLSIAACGSNPADVAIDAGNASEPTYYQDIKPILDAKCVGCHVEGGIAPMSLEVYGDAKAYAGLSLMEIRAGVMPPWPPNDECDDYVGNRSLTAEESALFERWAEGTMAEGDATSPAEPLDVEREQLSRVDLELAMTEAYTPSGGPDDYRCFVIHWPETLTKFVTGFRAIPGNDAIVHHVIAFLADPAQVAQYQAKDAAEAGPGYRCFGGSGGPSRTWLGAWAPGDAGSDMPEGVGIEVAPGSAIVLQVHYNVLAASSAADTTAVQMKLSDSVDKRGRILLWSNPNWLSGDTMRIPANEAAVTHSFAFDPTVPGAAGGAFLMHTVSLHMHTLGERASLTLQRNGQSDCALQIDAWDFDWQGSYRLREPKLVEPGDQLTIECQWNNTIEKQRIVNGEPQPPRDVFWGEGTSDEMCLGVMLISEP